MTKAGRLSQNTPEVGAPGGRAHSLIAEHAPQTGAVGLGFDIPEPGGQELGRGRFELPLLVRCSCKMNTARE